jgi:hypothetical protein
MAVAEPFARAVTREIRPLTEGNKAMADAEAGRVTARIVFQP